MLKARCSNPCSCACIFSRLPIALSLASTSMTSVNSILNEPQLVFYTGPEDDHGFVIIRNTDPFFEYPGGLHSLYLFEKGEVILVRHIYTKPCLYWKFQYTLVG